MPAGSLRCTSAAQWMEAAACIACSHTQPCAPWPRTAAAWLSACPHLHKHHHLLLTRTPCLPSLHAPTTGAWQRVRQGAVGAGVAVAPLPAAHPLPARKGAGGRGEVRAAAVCPLAMKQARDSSRVASGVWAQVRKCTSLVATTTTTMQSIGRCSASAPNAASHQQQEQQPPASPRPPRTCRCSQCTTALSRAAQPTLQQRQH